MLHEGVRQVRVTARRGVEGIERLDAQASSPRCWQTELSLKDFIIDNSHDSINNGVLLQVHVSGLAGKPYSARYFFQASISSTYLSYQPSLDIYDLFFDMER